MRTLAIASAVSLAFIAGCSITRADRLRAKSDKVESSLKTERARVLALAGDERQAKLDHLTMLRAQLSAANIGLGSVPLVVPTDKRSVAYDVLDEVYDTIDWNIPLGPSEPKRPMPSQFSGGVLNLN